jgi:hypothetical protein
VCDNDGPILRLRIIDALVAAGFAHSEHRIPAGNSGGMFAVVQGAGVAVRVEWWDAGDVERRQLLDRLAVALREAGFPVEDRGDRLYVPESGGCRSVV